MTISLPQQGLVLLMGASRSGNSSFAARHFLPTEVVSLARCREMICDDENEQSLDGAAYELLHTIVRIRLQIGRFTVVDAPNLRPEDRLKLKKLAKDQDQLCSLISLEAPKHLRLAGSSAPADGEHSSAAGAVGREKYHRHFQVSSGEQAQVEIVRCRLQSDLRDLAGPFDIVGDLHGCATELEELLEALGYGKQGHPQGRKLIFLGDLTDRGPRNLDCYRLVKCLVDSGQALCVVGNHDAKVLKLLQGRDIQIAHGLELTRAELELESEEFKCEMASFLESLCSHYVLDEGRLVVAHAGLKERYQGRESNRVRMFCLYGDTTGETDQFGLPVRLNWAADYEGQAMVVYGHTPVLEAVWHNRTINIDTGCVFGGALTALRYPELELVRVPAAKVYWEPKGRLG